MTSYELIAIALLGLAPLLVGLDFAYIEYKRQAYCLYSNRRYWWDVFCQFFEGWFECLVAEAACILALSIILVPLYYLIWGA